jgi:hypothetical protein
MRPTRREVDEREEDRVRHAGRERKVTNTEKVKE